MSEDAREQLAGIVASLRAYLEWQEDTGAHGIPRRAKTAAAPAHAPVPATAHAHAPVPERPPAEPAHAPSEPSMAAAPAPFAPASPFAPVAAKPPPAPSPAPAALPATATSAERVARLSVLKDDVASCRKCGLAETRTQTVFARGNPEAKLCFIGEAPGADEDAEGTPFVGRAGQLLDKMIVAMGLSPERDVYVCNIIKCRPPGNRRPTPEETDACIPYLHEQLALLAPRVIVALGNTAVGTLLGTTMGISKIRGQWKLYKGTTLVMPTYHPSYLLRPSPQQSEAKREAWEDLQAVMKELGLTLPKRSG